MSARKPHPRYSTIGFASRSPREPGFSFARRGRRFSQFLIFATCCLALYAKASAADLGKGDVLETLVVGTKTYTHALVRDVTVHSITITDTNGIASIPLRSLSPELQKAFGYNAAAEAKEDDRIEEAQTLTEIRKEAARKKRELAAAELNETKFVRLLHNFNQPPDLRVDVDLRPRYRELALGIKDQGLRPSCAIFCIVSALEFQNAELTGAPERLSEEYLLWATRYSAKGLSPSLNPVETEEPVAGEKDEGFSLSAVVAALRSYGIPTQAVMPNTFGSKIGSITAPTNAVIEQAKNRMRILVHFVPGNSPALRIGNLAQALNERIPVAIGLRWPHARTLRSGYISEQKPVLDYRHAVTLVGYHSDTGQIEDTVFIFKNSYGIQWGEAGYGRVTYRYLSENLLDAVVLEVRKKV